MFPWPFENPRAAFSLRTRPRFTKTTPAPAIAFRPRPCRTGGPGGSRGPAPAAGSPASGSARRRSRRVRAARGARRGGGGGGGGGGGERRGGRVGAVRGEREGVPRQHEGREGEDSQGDDGARHGEPLRRAAGLLKGSVPARRVRFSGVGTTSVPDLQGDGDAVPEGEDHRREPRVRRERRVGRAGVPRPGRGA